MSPEFVHDSKLIPLINIFSWYFNVHGILNKLIIVTKKNMETSLEKL